MKIVQMLKAKFGLSPGKAEPQPRDWLAELQARHGPFAPAFLDYGLSVPGYLVLLNLTAKDEELGLVLDRIDTAVRSDEADQWRASLFNDPNWRPHLVGALAALLAKDAAPYIPHIWHAIDIGSWVTPQLAATARMLDPDFLKQAIARVDARGAVSEPRGLTMLERHSAMGPSGTVGRQAKMLASLLALCDSTDMQEWSQQMRRDPEIAALLEHDCDDAGEIAQGWMAEIQAVLEKRGWTPGSRSS